MKTYKIIFLLMVLLAGSACVRRGSSSSSSAVSAPAHTTTAVSTPAVNTPELSQDAYKCDVQLSGLPEQLKPGQVVVVKVKITNTSKESWPVFKEGRNGKIVNLAYKWIDPQTSSSLKEGARTVLPDDLLPGASVEVDMPVVGYENSGKYIIEIEPVHELVTWFGWKGECQQRADVTIAR